MIEGWSKARILVLALACLLPAACTKTSDAPGNPKASTAAVAFTYQLAGRNWQQVYSHFDPPLARALPPARMTILWHSFEAKYGPFDSASAADNRKDGPDKTNVLVACHFLNGTQFLLWTIVSAHMRVSGLHLAGGS
ncbi:MAG: hypothetical protein ACRD04_08770 [Terriglobales bacterium]